MAGKYGFIPENVLRWITVKGKRIPVFRFKQNAEKMISAIRQMKQEKKPFANITSIFDPNLQDKYGNKIKIQQSYDSLISALEKGKDSSSIKRKGVLMPDYPDYREVGAAKEGIKDKILGYKHGKTYRNSEGVADE